MTGERDVVAAGDGWVVVEDGRVSSVFSSRETATAFANLRAARDTPRHGEGRPPADGFFLAAAFQGA